jgi:peptide/nickel transport system substrate-binding protein
VTTTIPVGNAPAGIAVGEGAVWVTLTLDDSLVRVDPETGSVTKVIRVGRAPAGVAVGFGAVWVANSGDGTLSRVDPSAGEVVGTTEVGASPQAAAVGDGRVWVSVSPRALPEAKPGGTARLASREDVDSLDPALAATPISWQLGAATGAKLLNYPDTAGGTGSQLEPEVAESLPSRSPDGRTYTFRIRPGFRFSPPSNQPVTARTFKYAIERTLSPRLHTFSKDFLMDVVGAAPYAAGRARHITGITAVGRTLRIRLTRPAADLPARLALPFFAAVPIGTPIEPKGVRLVPSAGPYYVASYTPGEGVLLERNPNYRGSRPRRLKRIRLAVGQRNPVADVDAGRADYAPDGVTPRNASRLNARYGPRSSAAKAGHQQYFTSPALATDHLHLNASRGLFLSARMRRAVNYAIDRRALARQGGRLNGIPAEPLAGYLPPGVPGFSDERVYPLTPDAARARRLAGHRRSKAVLWTPTTPPAPALAEVVKSNLRAIGIDVAVRLFPEETFYQRLSTRGARFDIALDGWFADYPDPADFLMLFDGRTIKARDNLNFSYFDDAGFNRRLDAAGRLAGPRRYLAFRRLALDLARKEAPWAAYASETRADFISARMGCAVEQPIYGLDLAALCIRR